MVFMSLTFGLLFGGRVSSGSFPYLLLPLRGVLQERNPCLFKAAPNGKIPVCEGKRQQIAEETERAKVAKMEVGKTEDVESY